MRPCGHGLVRRPLLDCNPVDQASPTTTRIMQLRDYSALAAIAGLTLTTSSAFAGDIDIANGDFNTDVGDGTNPVVADWNEGANSPTLPGTPT
jgi:hypothetical protein